MREVTKQTNVVPVIETERLLLRAHRPDDFAACQAMWSDPEVLRYTTGRPLTREEVWTRILRYAGLWQVVSYGYWALEEKASGKFIGELGFADFKRDMTPGLDGVPEAGWILISPMHGMGYATEGMRAAIDWADKNIRATRSVCIIHEANQASVRLAGKVGYREFERTVYKDHRVILLERCRPEPHSS